MFTYSCDVVIEQSENVTLGAYSAQWTVMPMNKSGRMIRNDLIMVVARSRRVCCLTAYGFFPVSLETYTKVNAHRSSQKRIVNDVYSVNVAPNFSAFSLHVCFNYADSEYSCIIFYVAEKSLGRELTSVSREFLND